LTLLLVKWVPLAKRENALFRLAYVMFVCRLPRVYLFNCNWER